MNGLHPGMSESDLVPNLQLIKTAGELGIYSSPKRDLVAGVYRGRVVTAGGPRLMETDGTVLLEVGERADWIEKCLGQKHRAVGNLQVFACGLAIGTRGPLFGSYFLGDVSKVEILQLAMLVGGPAS